MSGKKDLFQVPALKGISVYEGWGGMAGFMAVGALERDSTQVDRETVQADHKPPVDLT